MSGKAVLYLSFFISVIGQPILAYTQDIGDSIKEYFPYTEGSVRYMNIADSSNLKRIKAARDSIDFLLEQPERIIVGSKNYTQEANVKVIPHHWVLLPSVTYGFVFCLLYMSLIFLSMKYMNNRTSMIVIVFFVSGSILGSVPIVNCLPLIVFYSRIET